MSTPVNRTHVDIDAVIIHTGASAGMARESAHGRRLGDITLATLILHANADGGAAMPFPLGRMGGGLPEEIHIDVEQEVYL